jgi:hypothetical protein
LDLQIFAMRHYSIPRFSKPWVTPKLKSLSLSALCLVSGFSLGGGLGFWLAKDQIVSSALLALPHSSSGIVTRGIPLLQVQAEGRSGLPCGNYSVHFLGVTTEKGFTCVRRDQQKTALLQPSNG